MSGNAADDDGDSEWNEEEEEHELAVEPLVRRYQFSGILVHVENFSDSSSSSSSSSSDEDEDDDSTSDEEVDRVSFDSSSVSSSEEEPEPEPESESESEEEEALPGRGVSCIRLAFQKDAACSVCINPLISSAVDADVAVLACGHKFHAACLRGWKRGTCPNCRFFTGNKRRRGTVHEVVTLD